MKKILTASLVAMMAVTAANADIASTTYVNTYVNTQAGIPEDQATFSATDFTGAAAGKTNIKDAVNAIAGAVAGLSGDGTGSVSDQIDNALSSATAGDFSESVQGSLTKADNSVQTTDFNSFKTQNTQAIADAKQEAINTAGTNADSKISTAKAAMKLDATGGAGNFIQQVAQADGTVTATATPFDSVINDTSTVAPQTKAIKSYVDAEISTLSGNNSALSAKVTSLEQWKTSASTSIADNADDITDLQAADTAMGGRVNALEADNTTNKSNITTLQGQVAGLTEGESSVASQIEDKVGTLAGGAVTVGEAIANAQNTAQTYTDTQIQTLDSSIAKTEGSVLTSVTITDGKITASEKMALTALANFPVVCQNADTHCALTINGGELAWEVVAE